MLKAVFCPVCGASVPPMDVSDNDKRPLTDDVQLWAALCSDCYDKQFKEG